MNEPEVQHELLAIMKDGQTYMVQCGSTVHEPYSYLDGYIRALNSSEWFDVKDMDGVAHYIVRVSDISRLVLAPERPIGTREGLMRLLTGEGK